MKVKRCVTVLLLHISTAIALFTERKPFPCPTIPRTDGHRPGHLEQLGCQRPPLGPVTEYFEAPTPRELYENHVIPDTPAVIRNALKGSPALSKWTDDKYLMDMYGDQEVLVEKKDEDRKSIKKRMPIKDFLENYQDQNWYAISILPNAMRRDIRIPTLLVCSSFKKNLAELDIWIGTNGTSSTLHYDADELMHCVISGFKDWILIDRSYKDKIDIMIGYEGQGSGFSHIDVDSVNEDINPEMWDVPWQYVTLHSGDCLYVPHKYPHQVRSFNRTISAGFLWYPKQEFNDEDCKNANYDEYLNLTDTYVEWTYEKGQETVDLGYFNPHSVKRDILNMFDVFGLDRIDVDTYAFLSAIQLRDVFEMGLPAILKLFAKLDEDRDGYVTRDEFESTDVEYIKEYCRAADKPRGPTKNMLKQSGKYSAQSPEFAPMEYRQRYADLLLAKIFMEFVLRVKGKEGGLTFPIFKDAVQVIDGHIADAFLLFDKDFNGVITAKELNDTSPKLYRDFSRMRYNLVGTKIRGGGKHNEEVKESNVIFVEDLHEIPEEFLLQEKQEKQVDENISNIQIYLMKLREDIGDGIDVETFSESSAGKFNLSNSVGNKITFGILDRNKDGLLTASDIEEVVKSETNDEYHDLFRPIQLLGLLEEPLKRMEDFRPAIEKFKLEMYGPNIVDGGRPAKSEL